MLSAENKQKIDELFNTVADGIEGDCRNCIHADVCHAQIYYGDVFKDMMGILRGYSNLSRKELDEMGYEEFTWSFFANHCRNFVTARAK